MSREAELLTGVHPRDAAAVLSLGHTVGLATGDKLFRLGDEADHLFTINRGRVALTLPMSVRDRDEDILIDERASGQTVGWSALIPPHRFTLTATALAETEVVALPRTALVQYFTDNPAVGYAVTRNVASVIGQRLQVFQAMWLREMQRVVKLSHA
jgi:CRP/FNR family transcriptional regulator, cyclic AMP receptor protein